MAYDQDIITDQRARDLLVSVYHHIKRSPEHWIQQTWRCNTGMCMAGWVVAAGLPEISANERAEAGASWSPQGYVVCDLLPREWVLPWDKDDEVAVSTIAEVIIGVRPQARLWHDKEECITYACLWDGDNSLADIRLILTELLRADPEDLAPDEDIMLNLKIENEHYTYNDVALDAALAALVHESKYSVPQN